MTELNFSETTKMLNDIKSIVEENKQMKSTFAHYQEYAKRIKDIGQSLIELAQEIDPYQKTARNGTKTNMRDIIAEFYEVCKNGTSIHRSLIQNTYPELSNNNIVYIMSTLKDMPHVKVTKKGVNNILYYG